MQPVRDCSVTKSGSRCLVKKRRKAARVELQSPPYVCDEPKRRSLDNIAINRPVFCTSAEEEHPARNVTNGDMKTY